MILYLASILLCSVGIIHSYLGEKYLITRLLQRDNLPKILGSVEFTKNTLRFAWHLTTVAWFGLAAIILLVSESALSATNVIITMVVIFTIHFVVALVASKGRHLSWLCFLVLSVLLCVWLYSHG